MEIKYLSQTIAPKEGEGLKLNVEDWNPTNEQIEQLREIFTKQVEYVKLPKYIHSYEDFRNWLLD